MPNENTLTQTVEQAFGRVLEWLTSEQVPASFDAQVRLYGELRGKLGTQGVADALNLKPDELSFFNKIVADVDRRLKAPTEDAERNLNIAELRLLSWIETMVQRNPDADWSIDVDAIVSEDMGRKRVRALELVVRSLVDERHASQESLVANLREMFGDRVVDKWLQSADRDDVLSGTAFSELASIFVNKEEFANYEHLYDDTPFLTLLREKRKTIQSFLDDIRRIRNALAHNKRISNVQLSLLDIYYDELMSPVEHAHDSGQTTVSPEKYLQVSDQDLNDYFSNLHDDVMSVKDDIADLKESLVSRMDAVSADTAQIKETTHRINKRLAWTVAGVGVAVVVGLIAIYQNWGTDQKVAEVGENAKDIKEDTGQIVDKTKDIERKTKQIADTTKRVEETTKDIADSGKRVEATTKDIADTTKRVEATTKDIADTGKRVEANTADIRDKVGEVAESSKKVVESLDAIRDGFRSLTKLGGIVPDPDTPQEVYHNARVYEQRGDYGNARKSYARFFAYDLDLVDPHLRFQSFLKLQEGRAGAREIYNDLKARSKSFVTGYANILLQEPKKRVALLTKFTEDNKDFAPAFYELSREFSEARLGDQAASDKVNEMKYLEQFVSLHDDGKFLKFMLDQKLADEQLADARKRLEALKVVDKEALKNPISLTAFKNASGWTVNVAVVGQAKEIFYKKEGEGEFESTGHQNVKNFETGFALPNMTIQLERDIPKTTLLFKYTDTRDREQGPFEVVFDPKAELLKAAKQILRITTNSWVAFRDFNGKTLIYFSHLMTQRHALAEIRYGIDVEKPDKLYKFPPPDPDNPGAIRGFLPFFEVPASTKFATVQLKYIDGTLSKIHRFKR